MYTMRNIDRAHIKAQINKHVNVYVYIYIYAWGAVPGLRGGVRPEHISTEHIYTEHISTEHISTKHVSSEHISTEHISNSIVDGLCPQVGATAERLRSGCWHLSYWVYEKIHECIQ